MASSDDQTQDEIERNSSQTAQDLDQEIAQLWPEMPDEEAELWSLLPLERKRDAVLRLRSVNGRHKPSGGPPLFRTALEAADAAGVSRPTYYAIEKGWRENRSLASLRVFVPRASKDAPPRPRDALREKVRAMLIEHPRWGAPDVFRTLEALEEAPPSFTTVLRLVKDVRRELPTDQPLGQRLIFDSAGLDLVDERGQHRV